MLRQFLNIRKCRIHPAFCIPYAKYAHSRCIYDTGAIRQKDHLPVSRRMASFGIILPDRAGIHNRLPTQRIHKRGFADTG